MLDVKLVNARIFTLDDARPIAHSLGILGGRIVGLDDDIDALAAGATIDCGQAVVVPGFSDSHNHMAWFGQTLSELNLSECQTLEQLYAAVADFAAALSDDDWVIGSGYDDTAMNGHPNRHELDRAAGGRPVWLKHRSGHMCTVSSEVLDRAGLLDGSATIPADGIVDLDDDGTPSGLLQEQAQTMASALVLPFAVSELADAIGRASRVYASEGLVHVTEAGIGAGWIGRSPVELAAYRSARERGTLKTRVQLMVAHDALHPLSAHSDDRMPIGLDLGITTGFGDDWIRLGAMKIFVDGSLIGRTAAMSEPFCDRAHNSGTLQMSVEQTSDAIVQAHTSGWTVAAHAIGDRAVEVALNAFETAQEIHPRPTARHRIEHAGIVRPEQVARFRDLGITPVPQARFLLEVGDTMAEAVGPAREDWIYRHRSFLTQGVRVPGSSDRPVAKGAPLLGMQSMVQRASAAGLTIGADERVSAEQALRAYTTDAAWVAGDEAHRGTLTPGKLADFVLLAEHPAEVDPNEIGQIAVLATFIAGECVHGEDFMDSLRC
ncbi:MAG: amidohydrolase [Cryobacterium sp.]